MSALQNMKIAVTQMTSLDRMDENLRVALGDIKTAAGLGAQLVIFPENTLYLRLDSGDALRELDLAGAEAKAIAAATDKNKIDVLLTTATAGSSGKSKNSTVHFQPGAEPKVVYSKIHMFDVEVDGAPPVRESEKFVSGEGPAVIEIGGWRFGLSICYDLRFAELYSRYAGSVDAILVPSAFLVPTGQAHWHVLLRARAIENQCYVIAPAQCGEHRSARGTNRQTFGHSLVVDPWGHVELDNDLGPGVKIVECDAKKIAWARKQIPMQHHRRMLGSK